ncbi:MAG: cobalamin-binding protein [Candidatus Eremiobacteraeota bacterium]|nr:cobalamin-binding protein [Candidatus Eremiobacteraeota bacterium]
MGCRWAGSTIPGRAVRIGVLVLVLVWALHGMAIPAGKGYSVKDSSGNILAFPSVPRRIISTAPSITELLFALGAGKNVVGVTRHCNYPPEARGLPRIGDLLVNMEQAVKLSPDLVVADASMNPDSARRLKELGMPVLLLKCNTIENFRKSLEILGSATGNGKRARALMQDIDRRIRLVEKKVAARGRVPVRVFVEIWDSPLMTAGKETFFHDLITRAGGINVAASAASPYPRVGAEFVVEQDPEVIILTTSQREEVLRRSTWQSVSAVRSGRVHHIDPDIIARPTPRMIEALELLALWITPPQKTLLQDRKSPLPPKCSYTRKMR